MRGQGTTEYAIALALVAMIAISALLFLSSGIGDVLANVSNGFGPHASGATPTVPAKATPTPKPTKTAQAHQDAQANQDAEAVNCSTVRRGASGGCSLRQL